MKNIAVLGSTGSIGTQALDVIKKSNGEFRAVCICAGSNVKLLAKQANEFRPSFVGICDKAKAKELASMLTYPTEIVAGDEASIVCASYQGADTVVTGISGIAGFLPLMSAIESGKTIAAANKESILCAHSLLGIQKDDDLIRPFKSGARIIPVDSEQSAIFQCLEDKSNVKSLILTASGGAFRDLTKEELSAVTVEDALSHPTWSMGRKITVDSASLFNKGLEIMEAAFLFGFDADSIEVLIHKQSIVHSMVRFHDGSVKAQLSVPDMRGAIQYAFTYPNRVACPIETLDLTKKPLTFEAVDTEKYPAISLAYEALREGKILPIVYNGANEAAVDLFMQGKIRFTDIPLMVEHAMKKADRAFALNDIYDIIEADKMARAYALDMISGGR